MLTLRELTDTNPILRWTADGIADPDRVIDDVIRCGPEGPLATETGRILWIVPDAAGLELVRDRAPTTSAVVVCEPRASGDAQFPMPLLTPAEPWDPAETSEAVLRELHRAVQMQTLRLAHYMNLTARALVEGTGPARLLTRVATDMRARVELYGHGEETWPEELRDRAPQLRQLVTGSDPGSVRATVRGRHMQVWPVGAAGPRGLLVAIRREPWTSQNQLELQQIANVSAGLLREESISQRERNLGDAVRAARTAAFQYLMVGDVVAAERALEPLVPGLVGAVAAQVAVAEVAPGESREALTKEIETALASTRALTVLCPVDDGQVIVVWDGSHGRVQRPLEAVAQAVQGRAVGVSGLGPLAHTARLYDAAAVSVEAARRVPEQVAAHDGRPPLPELLDASARAWARELLMRLDQVEGLTWQDKRNLLDVCRTGLAMGAAGAARLTGKPHRQTITARLDELARWIGLDRTLIQHRVAMDLALQLAELPPPPPGTTPAADVVEALDQDAAREWGHAVLTGLPPRLLTAVAAWVRNGMNNQAAARELDISRNLMGEWLAEASGYVHLPLGKDRPGAAHQLVWALHVTGRVRLTSLSGDAGGRTASPPEPGVPTMELRTDVAQPARMYDYFLGGRTNYAADRKAADAVLESMPTAPAAAKANRFFMHRAVRWLAAEAGMRQFLDLGTGIPTEPNLHQVVQDVTPGARVVYVDNDPIVLAHAQTLLTSHPKGSTAYLQADARKPDTILNSETVRETLDLSQPVALSLVALLHFVDDQETAEQIVSRLTSSLALGSYLVLSHGTPDFDPEGMQKVMDRYRENGLTLRYRSRAEILDLFGDLTIIEPGLQPVHRWRPERPERDLAADDERAGSWGAIARI